MFKLLNTDANKSTVLYQYNYNIGECGSSVLNNDITRKAIKP